MANDLAAFGARLAQVVDGSAKARIMNKAGMAGKKAALEAASDDLGGDRSFSGMRRKAPLGAGYDVEGDLVRVNFRPAGLWNLADKGRRSSGPIRPRKKRAVLTPQGPRARSSYGPSRGLGTVRDAFKKAHRDVPKAAAQQFHAEVARVVGG